MASTITDAAINEAILSNSEKLILTKINDGTAVALDVTASIVDHGERAILIDLINGVATRVGINSRKASLPFKAVALAIANV